MLSNTLPAQSNVEAFMNTLQTLINLPELGNVLLELSNISLVVSGLSMHSLHFYQYGKVNEVFYL